MLQFMGSQRLGHNLATEQTITDLSFEGTCLDRDS